MIVRVDVGNDGDRASGGWYASRLRRAGSLLRASLWRTTVPSLQLGGLDEHRYFSPAARPGARLQRRRARALAARRRSRRSSRSRPRLAAAAIGAGIGLGRVGSAIVIGMVALVTLWFVSLPFRIADLWWQHHWGLGPFNPGSWLARAAVALSVAGDLALAAIVAGRRARRALPALLVASGAAAFVAIAALFVFVSGWLGAAGAHPLATPSLRAGRRADRARRGRAPAGARAEGQQLDEPGERVLGRLRPVDARRRSGTRSSTGASRAARSTS